MITIDNNMFFDGGQESLWLPALQLARIEIFSTVKQLLLGIIRQVLQVGAFSYPHGFLHQGVNYVIFYVLQFSRR